MRRYLFAAGLVVVLVFALAGVKFKQISLLINFGKAAEAMGPPPEAVSTSIAAKTEWQGTIAAVGSVAAAKGVSISSEVPGVVTAIRFESGAQVKAGQVLVELDGSVERAQLKSVQARAELARTSAERSRRLFEKGALTRAQLDSDEANLKSVEGDGAALRAQIERKTIRAPFAGRLGIRQVNLGQFVNPGTPLTVLESLGALYVDFTLPQQELGRLAVGTPVKVALSGVNDGRSWSGKISAIDPTVDQNTRTVKARAAVDDPKDLRTGMFVTVSVVLPRKEPVVTVPATAVVRAPYGDSVFVVEPRKDAGGAPVNGPDGKPAKVARQQFVRVGVARGDFVAIDEGVQSGQEIVSAGAFKLRNGVPIVVNNSIKVEPQLAPRPENR
jgi:membrane fusion protein (multidrug efflux system)